MIPLTLAAVADVVGGELVLPGDADRVVDAVTIDSRAAAPGSLFIPLPGERTDGHDFIGDAASRGAAGYLLAIGRPIPEPPGAIVVDDPGDALLGLGAWVRDTVDPTVVAITGSSGKTTTKDLLAAATASHRRVVASPNSFNNNLGVPLTCCDLLADTEVLVAEVGARGRGHIAQLMPILRPDVSIVTNVSAAHLELFGTVDDVAVAKSELVAGLGPGGVAVLNADDPRVAAMAGRTEARVRTFGLAEDADVRAERITMDAQARARFGLVIDGRQVAQDVVVPVAGRHHVGNALAALAAADALGLDPEGAARALGSATMSRWRCEVTHRPDGVVVVNDAYNANPASAGAALDMLAAMEVTGRRWAVLGEMAELGQDAPEAHRELGARAAGVADVVIAVGPAAAGVAEGAAAAPGSRVRVERVSGPDAALELVRAEVAPGDAVLVKASRAVGLESVATGLLEPDGGGRA